MREKLIELLEADECPLLYVLGENMGALADYLIANGVRLETKQATSDKTSDESKRWIPVTERLPDVWQHPGDDEHIGEPIDFIVFIDGALIPTTLWFNGESFFDESGYLYNVTHWMPMPEPPKEV